MNQINPTIKYCIENSWSFLVFAIACYILLFGIRKYLPEIRRTICDLANILFKELKPGSKRILPEQINASVFMAFFIVTFLVGLFELMPSAIKQSLGLVSEYQPISSFFHSCVFYLFILLIGSPAWLYIMEREKRIRKMTEDTLK